MRRGICFLLSFVVLLAFTACEEKILHDLDELQVNQVRVVLARAGIEATKVREGALWSVSVAAAEATRALTHLEESRVLKKNLRKFDDESSSLIQSREERTHFLERKLSWGLEQTLERIPVVLEARVHLYLEPGEKLALLPEKKRQSASVLIVSTEEGAIDVESVKELVAGASGIESASVTVVLSYYSESEIKTEALPEEEALEDKAVFSAEREEFFLSEGQMFAAGFLALFVVFLLVLRRFFGRAQVGVEGEEGLTLGSEGSLSGEEELEELGRVANAYLVSNGKVENEVF